MSNTLCRTSLIKRTLAAVALLGSAACNNPFSGDDCVSLGVAGINATVVDAITNKAPITTPQIRIEDGAFVELSTPMPRVEPLTYVGALERPGVYRVTVTAVGYRVFVAEGIAVSRYGKCQYLQSVRVDVKLVPIA